MPWLDDSGAPVTDPLVLKQLGAPAGAPAPATAAPAAPPASGAAPVAPAGGRWIDDRGQPVTDPLVLKQLGGGMPPAPVPEMTTIESGIPALDAAKAFTEQAIRSATFGLSDKASALVPALHNAVAGVLGGGDGRSFTDTYHAELARQRAVGDQYAENHPFLSPAATALGVMTSAAPRAAIGGLQRNALGQFMPAMRVGNVGLPQGVGDLARQGATVGALTGFGGTNDESLAQNLQSAGAGALTGAATSGLLGTVGPRLAAAVHEALGSRIAHTLTLPGLLGAGYAAAQHPSAIPYAVGGLGGAYLLSRVPPRAAQALVPQAARATSGLAPALVAENQGG